MDNKIIEIPNSNEKLLLIKLGLRGTDETHFDPDYISITDTYLNNKSEWWVGVVNVEAKTKMLKREIRSAIKA